MNVLYHAHSGFRYLILLVALIAIVVIGRGIIARKSVRTASTLSGTFAVLLDLQILLGFALFLGGITYDALVGHMALMLIAAIVANAMLVVAPRAATERKELVIRLGAVLVALVCIVLGILAIGRSVMGSTPMSGVQ